MSPQTGTTRLTYDDLLLLPEDGRRLEIIDGRLAATAAPATRHQRTVLRLVGVLLDHLRSHPVGELFTAPYDVVLSATDVVEPDLLLVCREHANRVTEENLQGAPDLVVEVTSPSTRRRDLGVKKELYERCGVREYWVVDPDRAEVRVWRWARGEFGEPVVLCRDGGDHLETPLLPGFSVALAEILKM